MGRIALVCAALVLAVRTLVLLRVSPSANGDEAIVGLMALQIARGGPVPVFFYGQPYLGSLEAVLAAASFRLLGVSDFALRLAPLSLWVVYLALLYSLARRALGPRGALFACLLGLLPPSFVAVHVELAVGSYPGTFALGLAVLLLADLLAYPPQRSARVEAGLLVGLGVASGLGLWTHPQTAPFPAAAALLLAARRRDLLLAPRALLAPVGLIAALAPVIAWNATHHWATLSYLVGTPADAPALDRFRVALRGLAVFTLPEALGIRPFLGDQRVKGATASLLAWASAFLTVAAVLWLLAAALWRLRLALAAEPAERVAGGEAALRLAPTLVVGGASVALLALSRFGTAEPPTRYLAPASAVLPLSVAWLLVQLPPRAALPLLLAALLSGANQGLGAHPMPFAEVRTLASRLDALGIDRVYAGYWTAYSLAFQSRGAVEASPRFGPERKDRIPEYTSAVDGAPVGAIAFVFPVDSPEDRAFAAQLALSGVEHARETVAGQWHLYYRFSADPRPAAVVALGDPAD